MQRRKRIWKKKKRSMTEFTKEELIGEVFVEVVAKAAEDGICFTCKGKKVFFPEGGDGPSRPCYRCEGTGVPTEKEKAKAKLYREGICLKCGLPRVPGKDDQMHSNSGGPNDCLAHLRQYVLKLEQLVVGEEECGEEELPSDGAEDENKLTLTITLTLDEWKEASEALIHHASSLSDKVQRERLIDVYNTLDNHLTDAGVLEEDEDD